MILFLKIMYVSLIISCIVASTLNAKSGRSIVDSILWGCLGSFIAFSVIVLALSFIMIGVELFSL